MTWARNQENIDYFNSDNQFPVEEEDLFRYSETKENDEPDPVHLSVKGIVDFSCFNSNGPVKIIYAIYLYLKT